MSPRTGRPKAESPKEIGVRVRLDSETHSQLVKYCEKEGVSKAEAIRQGIHLILGKKEKDTDTLNK